LRQTAEEMLDPTERARLRTELATAVATRDIVARQVEAQAAALAALVIRAPRAGVVVGLPRRDEVGKLWTNDADMPFCRVGAPGRLRLVVALQPQEYALLREEMMSAGSLDATVRIHGHGLHVRRGKLTTLPDTETRDIPITLSTRAGDPVPVKAGLSGTRPAPLGQYYAAAIDLQDADPNLVPGVLAQTNIRCRRRSFGWWLRRSLSGLLEPGLL
jgi:hypothetical protein